MQVEFEAVCDILARCRRHLVVVNALDRLSISCFIPKTLAVKVAVKLRSRPKRWFLGPRFVGGGGIPAFGHAFVNYTYFRPCGRFSFSSVQRSRRSGGEKKKKERRKKETWVKYKSAPTYYVGRPNKAPVCRGTSRWRWRTVEIVHTNLAQMFAGIRKSKA